MSTRTANKHLNVPSISLQLRKRKNGKYDVYRVFGPGDEELASENRTLAFACRVIHDEVDYMMQNIIRNNYQFGVGDGEEPS